MGNSNSNKNNEKESKIKSSFISSVISSNSSKIKTTIKLNVEVSIMLIFIQFLNPNFMLIIDMMVKFKNKLVRKLIYRKIMSQFKN